MDVISCVAIAAVESWVITRFKLSEVVEHGDSANRLDTKQIFWTLLSLQYLIVKYYRIFLYHKYFSPLRHIPGPTVSITFHSHLSGSGSGLGLG